MDFSANQELKETASANAREAAQRATTRAALTKAEELLAARSTRFFSLKARPKFVFAGLCWGGLYLVYLAAEFFL